MKLNSAGGSAFNRFKFLRFANAHRLAAEAEAEAELDDIWLYIAQRSGSPDTADHFIDSLADRFCLLASSPYIGRRRDDDLRLGLRSFPVGNYVVIYRREGDDVLILHVIHGGRDIAGLI